MEDIFDLTQLREKAAKKINVDELKIETLSNDEIKKIFHELKVHEIELQLQNEELRNAQLKLEDQKNQYFKLFNNAPNGYAILDSNGLIVQANIVLQDIFEYDLPNLFDKPFNSFLLPNDSNKFLSNYQSFFKNPNGKIYKFKTSNKIIQIFGKLDHFAKSKTNEKMLLLTVVDVTQIEEANSQIAENSKLYRSIIQDSLEGFWLINKNGNFLDVNEAASKMLGYTKEEIIKLDITEIVVKKEFKNFEEQITETSKLINHKFNSKLIRKDKHIIEVEVSLSSIAKNGKNVIVGFIRDISEEVRSKQILKKRIELAEYSANHTVDEVIQKALDFAEELTNSKISFWHHIAEDNENISLQQWSTNTKNENCTAQNESHHANISSAGIWADCIRQRKPVIHNNYQNLEKKNDLPHGHAHLIRQVIVPVFKKNKIVAIIGIGNKPTNYVNEDVYVMEIFGNVAWTIYEKQFANETLIKSEQKNKAILGLLPDLLFEYSLNGTFLNYHCSDYSKLFLPPEKFMGKNVCDVLQPNIANLILKKINEAVSSNNMVSFEYSSNIGDMFQYFAVRIVQFTKNSVLCFMRDITEKQIAKELIIESEEKFSKVFFNSPLLKTINEIKTDKFVDINNKFLEITGYTKEETLGKTAVELGLL
ncbi:MAG: PAS domain S-box protein, partial [Ignavibacteriae bacterium]|nr:PAS domain S-box protein [Ignavibacteriota bacterium]